MAVYGNSDAIGTTVINAKVILQSIGSVVN